MNKKSLDISEMTDRELQESIAKNLRIVTQKSKSTNGWLTFIGLMFVLSIIASIFLISQA